MVISFITQAPGIISGCIRMWRDTIKSECIECHDFFNPTSATGCLCYKTFFFITYAAVESVVILAVEDFIFMLSDIILNAVALLSNAVMTTLPPVSSLRFKLGQKLALFGSI